MPVGFSGNRSAIGRAEKFDEIYFRDVVDIAALKCFQLPAGTPVVDGGLAVACELTNFQSSQNIFVLGKQCGIILVHVLQDFRREVDFQFDLIVALIPPLRCGISLRENFAVLQIGDHIFLFDLVAACLLACVIAGYLSALQKIPGSGLADMANPIQLILCDDIGNLIPVDGCVIHSNTPFKIDLPV